MGIPNANTDKKISIHALLAESDRISKAHGRTSAISIHALLAESDTGAFYEIVEDNNISIHALLAESDVLGAVTSPSVIRFLSTLSLRRATNKAATTANAALFLSTLSLRRATTSPDRPDESQRYFYPRSPCGERRAATPVSAPPLPFLSTLSLRRATLNQIPPRRFHYHFYPRSPCGERHLRVVDGSKSSIISIHALLAESDV